MTAETGASDLAERGVAGPARVPTQDEASRRSVAPVDIPPGLDATIVLLRHGESVFITENRFQGAMETPLSLLGERQVALAAARLARPAEPPALAIPTSPPIEIVHSPLVRAAASARIVADAMTAAGEGPSVELRVDDRLTEVGQGSWEGLHREEIERRDGPLLAAWRAAPLEANAPGGERVVDAAVRVGASLQVVIDRLASVRSPSDGQSSPAHVAGYPAILRPDRPWSLLVAHDGVFKLVLLTLLGLPLEAFWIFPFALAGISLVELRAGRGILRAHNLTEHLAPLERAAAMPSTAAPATPEERGGAL